MSERRKKRTRKANNPEVRDVQERESEFPVPQEVVPQQEGEGVVEPDTATRQEILVGAIKTIGEEQKEATMNWRDRLNMDKEAIIKMLMAVGISVCIMLIVFFTQGVPKGEYNADMTRMEQGITTMGSQIADTVQDINDNSEDIGNLKSQVGNFSITQLEGVSNTVALHTGNIESLKTRMASAETELATVGSPPEGYLTGNLTSGNLTLKAKASDAGNHTANIHLIFAPVINAGNATTNNEAVAAFYATVNWTATNVKAYIPVASYNGTSWGISQVWWNVGTFALAADTDTDIAVLFGGLNTTPSFAYAEIYPALR